MRKASSIPCFGRLLILQLIFLQFISRVSAIRNPGFLEIRDCKNTVQGRYLLSDDNGYVCDAFSLNPMSRCCPERGERFSCYGCNLSSRCCDSYEFCVSCCLNPSHTKDDEVLNVKIAKPSTAGTFASVFDFCAGRCRHNSESVVHENAYISEFHHCFSIPTNSSGDTNAQAGLAGINVIVGRQSESCDSVCKAKGQSCVPNKLFLLNQCEIMQKYMSCKGACMASDGSDQPAEVVEDAPSHMAMALVSNAEDYWTSLMEYICSIRPVKNPGACLFTQTQSLLSCDGSHQYTRRLCPCA